MTIRVLRNMVLTVVGVAFVASTSQAAGPDGVARVGYAVAKPSQGQPAQQRYYVATPTTQRRQAPNPTYWAWMPRPLHGCCDYCAEPGCPGKKGCWTFPIVRWILDPDYYAVAPDYGWSPPAKVSIRRQNVTYGNYAANGQRGGGNGQSMRRAPFVGTPTDTTQLGYYYQHAPTWQPRNILPVPPDPRQWHTRPCTPDQNMTYVRWMKLQNAWTPVQNIPVQNIPVPANAVPAQKPARIHAVPAPAADGPPVPVVPMRPGNAPEALNAPEIGEPIRRVSSTFGN